MTDWTEPPFDPGCRLCDTDDHRCGGCGEPLQHDQKTEATSGRQHPDCTADPVSSEPIKPETNSS